MPARVTYSSLTCVFLSIVVLASAGCGGPKTPAEKKQAARKDPVVAALHKMGEAYTHHLDATRKAPASWEELIGHAEKSGLDVDSIKLIRDKGYSVKWGTTYKSATSGVATFVLASPSGAGPRLMLDGSIQID